jgi:two-component system, chemotaxis family, sensor kinase CheA
MSKTNQKEATSGAPLDAAMSMAQDPELLRDYLSECDELLQRVDQDLVALEEEALDEEHREGSGGAGYGELVNRIFRAVHTIKGTSGFMGLDQIVSLTHEAEEVLNVLRKRGTAPGPDVMRKTMDALLLAHDQLRKMIGDVRQNTPRKYNLDSLISLLAGLRQDVEKEADRPMLGEIMVVEKAISRAELQESLAEAAWEGRKLGEVLVEKKLVSESQVREALGKQSAPSPGRESARTIRVDTAKLDELLNLVGELVLERNRLARLSSDLRNGNVHTDQLVESLADATGRLSTITEELQSASLRTRMVPIDAAFRRFPRLVRDIARSVGKDVELVIRGEETELDKNVVEHLADALVHLLRNSLDHGIESPEHREAAGKPRHGCVLLEAQQEGDNIVVSVSDDGGGMDPEKIGRKAVEKGLLSPERLAAMMERSAAGDSSELLNLIFMPGFSTVEQVSDLSGRGVGMDVVRSNLEKVNGVVEIESVKGEGTLVRLKLPLTLAILPVLLVEVRTETYALPLRSVQEIVRVPRAQMHRLGGSEMFRLRDRVIPLQYLSKMFRLTGPEPTAATGADLTVVILGSAEKRVGVVVDRLLGQEETVVKPLGGYLGHVPGMGGATISGDGHVRLILDPAALVETAEEAA